MLPDAREKMVSCCQDCRFFVQIQGKEEIRYGCVECIEKYRKFCCKVPPKIHVMEILKMVGKEGLEKILENGDPQKPACGKFLPKM
ncbi:MAG TPA: hypothetical protein DCE07_07355 [Peptococcaceae bacterium]|nr:hypothetical protein [Peptococcaceae bacterium]